MHFQPYVRQLIQRLGTKEDKNKDSDREYYDRDNSYTRQNIYANIHTLTDEALSSANMRSVEMQQTKLTDDQLMICSSNVRGYSLTRNEWSRYPSFTHLDMSADFRSEFPGRRPSRYRVERQRV